MIILYNFIKVIKIKTMKNNSDVTALVDDDVVVTIIIVYAC